ncbi:MAG: FAD-binding oxidoreductase [Pseudomonadota bacterium]
MVERVDVAIVGGGVFGLWAAYHLGEAGLKVAVLEVERAGSGASGGPVGALTPHMPRGWRPFKAFQRDALMDLPMVSDLLHAQTGIDIGYRRVGRLTPLRDNAARMRASQQIEAAETHWQGYARWTVHKTLPDAARGWLSDDACAHGLQGDTLSARLTPTAYLGALRAAVAQRASLREGWRVHEVRSDRLRADQGDLMAAQVVLAGGWRALAPLVPQPDLPPMRGVKGQAALLQCAAPADLPVLHADGIFVTRQGLERVAVGSTSERDWTSDGPDAALDDLLRRARHLVPPLANAPVIARWAGIRPRGPGREPLVGPLPGAPHLIAATGGYKIGLGIGHRVGAAIAALITGQAGPPLPESFLPSAFHDAAQRSKTDN